MSARLEGVPPDRQWVAGLLAKMAKVEPSRSEKIKTAAETFLAAIADEVPARFRKHVETIVWSIADAAVFSGSKSENAHPKLWQQVGAAALSIAEVNSSTDKHARCVEAVKSIVDIWKQPGTNRSECLQVLRSKLERLDSKFSRLTDKQMAAVLDKSHATWLGKGGTKPGHVQTAAELATLVNAFGFDTALRARQVLEQAGKILPK